MVSLILNSQKNEIVLFQVYALDLGYAGADSELLKLVEMTNFFFNN